VPGVKWVAFCDDLTLVIEGELTYDNLNKIIEAIDAFCMCGSDFVVNMAKTTLMSTSILSATELDVIKVSNWPRIKRVCRSVLLGVDFGTKVDEHDVWGNRMSKIEKLAKECLTYAQFSPAKRVRYANIYLIPILLFLAQYYPIPMWVENRVIKAIAMLVLPKVNAIPREFLYTEEACGGPPVPLREFIAEGKAALVRTLRPLFLKYYDSELKSIDAPLHLVEWHPLHPMNGISYMDVKHHDVIGTLRDEIWDDGWVSQRDMTRLFVESETRQQRSVEMIEKAYGRWSGDELGLEPDESWQHRHTTTFLKNMKMASKNRHIARARWITVLLGFNSLPTKTRTRVVEGEAQAKRGVGDERIQCALCCGYADDDVWHLYCECPTVKEGKTLMMEWLTKWKPPSVRTTSTVITKKKIGNQGEKAKSPKLPTVTEVHDKSSYPRTLKFIDHILGGSSPWDAESICLINCAIWDARCFYTAHLDFERSEIPQAMLRMLQESLGSKEAEMLRKNAKREVTNVKRLFKNSALAYYYDNRSHSQVRFMRYHVNKQGVRVMNRFLTNEHLDPLFDVGRANVFVWNEQTNEVLPFERYRIYNGQAVLNEIPPGCRPMWNETRARDILHPSVISPKVCWCFAYPNYPLLDYPTDHTQCHCREKLAVCGPYVSE
jgi:hypothetical protein